MLMNLTGKPKDTWDPAMLKEALKHFGGVFDIPFPEVDEQTATPEELDAIADELVKPVHDRGNLIGFPPAVIGENQSPLILKIARRLSLMAVDGYKPVWRKWMVYKPNMQREEWGEEQWFWDHHWYASEWFQPK